MKPVNIAILGAGGIAGHMADAVTRCPDVRGYAVAARDEGRARALSEQYGFERYYGSYEAMLKDDGVQLVYIAVPHALHAQCAIMCLEAGKHVVVEKPFAANAAQAKAIIDAARKNNRMAAEGLWMRYLPVINDIKALCASGMIGDIRMLSGEIGYHLSQERLFDPAMAGGALLDVGVYAIAFAGLIFGYDVASLASSAVLTQRGVDETNSFIIKYSSGQMASLSTSMTYMSTCRGTIWGSNGYVDIDNINRMSDIRVYDSAKKEIARYSNPPVENSYVFELYSLVKALDEGRLDTPEAPHEEILKRMELMDALRAQWGVAYPFENAGC